MCVPAALCAVTGARAKPIPGKKFPPCTRYLLEFAARRHAPQKKDRQMTVLSVFYSCFSLSTVTAMPRSES